MYLSILKLGKNDNNAGEINSVAICNHVMLCDCEASNVHIFAANKHKNEVTPNEGPSWKAKLSLNKSRDSEASTSFLICTCNIC